VHRMQSGKDLLFEGQDDLASSWLPTDRLILVGACEIAVTGLKASYGVDQIEGQPGFVDTAVGAGFNGTFFELRGIVVAHHQNFDLRNFLADSTRGVKAASVGHADIQEN